MFVEQEKKIGVGRVGGGEECGQRIGGGVESNFVDGWSEAVGSNEADAVAAERFGAARIVDALEVGLDGAGLEVVHVALHVAEEGARLGGLAPVVEDAREVSDIWIPFAETEDEFVILNAVERRIEAAERASEGSAHAENVADIHDAAEEFRREAGFEQRKRARAVGGEFVFVGVDGGEIGCGGEFGGELGERVRANHVVVIEHDDVVARGGGEGGVGGAGNAGVLGLGENVDAGIEGAVVLEERWDFRGGRGVVDDAKFPRDVMLGANGFDAGAEEIGGRVVNREEDRKKRSVCGGGRRRWWRIRICESGPVGIGAKHGAATGQIAGDGGPEGMRGLGGSARDELDAIGGRDRWEEKFEAAVERARIAVEMSLDVGARGECGGGDEA